MKSVLALSAFCFAAPAIAGNIPITTEWHVDQSSLPTDANLKKGDNLALLNLYPQRLVQQNADAKDAVTGSVVSSEGGQFVEYKTQDGKAVFCSTKTIDLMNKKGSIIYFRYNDTHICMLDANNDGAFDASYEIRTGLQSETTALTHGKDGSVRPLAPTTYADIDRTKMDTKVTLQMAWWYGKGAGDGNIISLWMDGSSMGGLRAIDKGSTTGSATYGNLKFDFSSTVRKEMTAKITKTANAMFIQTSGTSIKIRTE